MPSVAVGRPEGSLAGPWHGVGSRSPSDSRAQDQTAGESSPSPQCSYEKHATIIFHSQVKLLFLSLSCFIELETAGVIPNLFILNTVVTPRKLLRAPNIQNINYYYTKKVQS